MEIFSVPQPIKLTNHTGLTSISKIFEETLDQSCYTSDLIIKVGPAKYEYYCHRLIFATASNFLRSIIESATPGTIPVLLLPDVNVAVIDYVLLYMYYGVVQVPVEHYQDFVEACQLLQLKGPVDQGQMVSCWGNVGMEMQVKDELEMESEHDEEQEPIE